MVLIILILCILVMLFFIYILSNRNKSIFKEKESLKENLEREVKRNEQSEIENRDLQIIIKEKNNKIQNLISKIEEQDFEIERLNSSFLEQKDRIKELSTQIDIEKENGKKLIEELKNRENAIKELEKNKDEVEIKKRLENLNTKFIYEQEKFEGELNYLKELKNKLLMEIEKLEEKSEFQQLAFYEPKYYYETSKGYKEALDKIYEKEKNMIKNKKAVICTKEWIVEGSKTKGKKMLEETLKLLLRAFNGESDTAIARVKYNNIKVMEERIKKVYIDLNKLVETKFCFISEEYFNLKLEELRLNYEYANKIYDEKEEQRLIKEQMREEQKAIKEREEAIKESQKKEIEYEKALEKAKVELERANLKEKEELLNKIKKLEENLENERLKKERAISQAQLTKSGHVYIISNIGSFGENIYKIGMTRRLEPIERIKELSSASVPFPFDVHAFIYSEDAPKLENALHRQFNEKRVNLINQKREFFNVTLNEIEDFIKNNYQIDFHVTRFAEAEQYRQTLSLRSNNIIPQFDRSLEIEDEDIYI